MTGDNGEEPKELTVKEKLALEPVGRAPEPHEIELLSFIKADLTEALKLMDWDTTPAAMIKAMFLPSLWAVVFYRISSWAYFRSRLLLPVSALFFWLNIMLFGCEISGTARIGKGFVIAHTVGVGIGSDVQIGERFRIMKGATIGSTGRFLDRDPGMPTIGDDVWLLFSAAIGGKVTIGNRVMISAGAGVVTDIPHHTFVLGNMTSKETVDLDLVLPEWQRPVQMPDGTWDSPNCRTIFGPPKAGFEIPSKS